MSQLTNLDERVRRNTGRVDQLEQLVAQLQATLATLAEKVAAHAADKKGHHVDG